jgi:hypothetical protein
MVYQVSEHIDGADRDIYYVDIPTSAGVDLGTLATYETAPAVVRVLVVPDMDALGYATDTDVADAITAHQGAVDPHIGYMRLAEFTAGPGIELEEYPAGQLIISAPETGQTRGEWALSLNITGAPPNAGFRYNNLTFANITELAVDKDTAGGDTLDTVNVSAGDDLTVTDSLFPTLVATFTVIGAAVDQGTWWSVPVDFVTGNTGVTSGRAYWIEWVDRIDHGALTGLADNDHPQYQLAGGAMAGPLNHDGTTVGFYGTTPVTKQTAVPVSAAGVHAALVALGLIT